MEKNRQCISEVQNVYFQTNWRTVYLKIPGLERTCGNGHITVICSNNKVVFLFGVFFPKLSSTAPPRPTTKALPCDLFCFCETRQQQISPRKVQSVQIVPS